MPQPIPNITPAQARDIGMMVEKSVIEQPLERFASNHGSASSETSRINARAAVAADMGRRVRDRLLGYAD